MPLSYSAASAGASSGAGVSVIASTTGELLYGNGELPNAFDGEAEGFQAFVQVHGYVPPTREVLIQWATNSQGGA